MDTRTKKKEKPQGIGFLVRTIRALHLPWLWIVLGLGVNLYLNHLMLDLPDTTADLLQGQFTGGALTRAILFYVEIGIMNVLAVAGQVQAQTYSVRKSRETVWGKMLGMRMEFFDRNDPSDLMSAIVNDTGSAVKSFVSIIINVIPDIYYVAAAMVRIRQYHWILALSCFAMLPLKYLYALLMGRQFQRHTAVLYGRIGVLTSFLADRICHLPLIKTYTNEEKEGQAGESAAREIMGAEMKLVQLDNTAQAAVSAMDILQKFIVVVVAVILLQRDEIDIAMWLAFFLFAQNLFPAMDNLFDLWTRVKGVQGGFQRVTGILEGRDEKTEAARPFPADGDIRFDHVTFTYPDTDRPALRDVSFTVPRGSAAAIVGLCGSGKTTSVSLLERFYTPDSGAVYIGDTEVRDLDLCDFRKNLSYVQQGAQVFSGTLREALTYGIDREVSDEEIRAAAEKTGFDEYIRLCGDCLDTPISSGGGSMSGGQSQRLVLTREVLRGGDIILMDEPTSALDVRVSAKIQDTMDSLFADKTRILITHDLRFARRYDRILVMENGRLVGDGSHEELMDRCETYRRMQENAEAEQEVTV